MQKEGDACRLWQDQPNAMTPKFLNGVPEATEEQGAPEGRRRAAARCDTTAGHPRVAERSERTIRSRSTWTLPRRGGLGLNAARA
jgi:hypothetical protein